MSFVSSWIMSILGIVILGTVVELLLSKSRLKNFIRSVFATVSVLVILTPLPSLINRGFDLNWSEMLDDISLDNGFIDYSQNLKIKTLESAIESALEDEGMANVEITVTGEIYGNEIRVKSVYVDLSNSVIKENLANINKYEFINERVKTFIGEHEVEIIVNE